MMSEDETSGGYTLQEHQILDQLKAAAGIGFEDEPEEEIESRTRGYSNGVPVSEGPYRNMDERSPQKKSRRLSVKDLADQMIPEDATVDPKPYAKLLLPNERVVFDSSVWKRSGLSFKNRILILTNKPRLFYTTTQGHFKGLIPWSMTEPIAITKIDETRFDISIHSSSRIYHFNDKIKGSDKWVTLIQELSECWRVYLESR